MPRMKMALSTLAAAGLAVAQPAIAASAAAHRNGTPTTESEQLAGVPGAAVPFLVALAASLVVMVISASHHHHHNPVSP